MANFIGIENFEEIPVDNIEELMYSIDRYGDLLFCVYNDEFDYEGAVFTNFEYLDFDKRGLPLIYDIYNPPHPLHQDEDDSSVYDIDRALNNPNNNRRSPFHIPLSPNDANQLKYWTFYIKPPLFEPTMLNWPVESWKSKIQ